jgi:predicted dehydrogenase
MDSIGQPPPTAPPREPYTVSADTNLFAGEADDFVATILDGKPPRISPEQSIGNMRVLDALRRQLGVRQ